jgi:methionyl aminopeptidase
MELTGHTDSAATKLDILRDAGRIARAARDLGSSLIVPGALLREVCRAVEDEIMRRGAGLAFPTQTSRNEVAAHYCPGPDDQTRYESGDLAKLDVGVHIDGWIVDTAVTVNVGGAAEGQALVDATQAALAVAIRTAGPGVPVQTIAAAIDGEIRRRGFRPVRNLCGHGVGRWTVHCAPPIPNTPDDTQAVLVPGRVVAIEPFASDGAGLVVETGKPEVFQLRGSRLRAGPTADAEVVDAIIQLHGLPFSRRQLAAFPAERVERTLRALSKRGLVSYPPLVEPHGRPVTQAEHSLYISETGVEVLT